MVKSLSFPTGGTGLISGQGTKKRSHMHVVQPQNKGRGGSLLLRMKSKSKKAMSEGTESLPKSKVLGVDIVMLVLVLRYPFWSISASR